jgi:hypothetical protein
MHNDSTKHVHIAQLTLFHRQLTEQLSICSQLSQWQI